MDYESASALAREAIERRNEGDPVGALAAADRYVAAFANGIDPAERELTADVLAMRAESLAVLGREPEALLAANELFSRYAEAVEPRLPYAAAFGLRAKTALLVNAGRNEEAAGVGELLAGFFERRSDAGRQPEIAEQLLEVGYMLMGRGEDLVAARLFGLVIDRMAEDLDQALLLTTARLDLVLALIHLGDSEALPAAISAVHDLGSVALVAIDQMIARLEGVSTRRWDLAATLSNKIAILEELDRSADAHSAIREFLDQFGEDQSPHLQPMVTHFREALAE